MKKFVVLLGAALALGGCASLAGKIVGASVSQTDADEAIRTGALAVTVANTYLGWPRCAPGVTPLKGACKSVASIVPVQNARNQLQGALTPLNSALAAAQQAGTGVNVASATYQVVMGDKTALLAALPASLAATVK